MYHVYYPLNVLLVAISAEENVQAGMFFQGSALHSFYAGDLSAGNAPSLISGSSPHMFQPPRALDQVSHLPADPWEHKKSAWIWHQKILQYWVTAEYFVVEIIL